MTQKFMVLSYHCLAFTLPVTIQNVNTKTGGDGGGLMLKDPQRYILTTANLSVMRHVLSLLLGEVKSEAGVIPAPFPNLEVFANDGCDRMILELRRPKEPAAGISPRLSKLRTSRLGRVLVVTGEATAPDILLEIEALRRPHLSVQHLTSGLLTFVRTLSCTLRLADPQN